MTSALPAPHDVRATLLEVARRLPHLATFAAQVTIVFDESVGTAAVDRRGELRLCRRWYGSLSREQRIGLLAHELLHLRLATAERRQHRLRRPFNLAHDRVINSLVEERYGLSLPREGVRRRGAHRTCAEKLYRATPEQEEPTPFEHYRDHEPRRANLTHQGEPLSFSDDPLDPEQAAQAVVVFGVPSASETLLLRPTAPLPALLAAFRDLAPPARRSLARASRRRAHLDPFAFPGRIPAASVHLLVDTSSSMLVRLAYVLNHVRAALAAAGHTHVAATFADGDVIEERLLPTEGPLSLTVHGRGDYELIVFCEPCDRCGVFHAYKNPGAAPTDLDPGLRRVGAAAAGQIVVVTDGLVAPARRGGADVTWVLPQVLEGFEPAGGRVVALIRDNALSRPGAHA